MTTLISSNFVRLKALKINEVGGYIIFQFSASLLRKFSILVKYGF